MFYEEQTGNVWGNKNFVKVPGKKVPVDTDYGQVIIYILTFFFSQNIKKKNH